MKGLRWTMMALAMLPGPAAAQTLSIFADGRTVISQFRAQFGNVTPGDAKGFPVLITAGGSYVLASDLVVPDLDTSAIVIRTSDPVTIDLNGFAIRGPNQCGTGSGGAGGCQGSGNGSGIETDQNSNTNGSTVYGGSIKGMGRLGVGLVGFGNVVRNMNVQHCRFGINATGLIHDNVLNRNGSSGISSFGAVVRNNHVSETAGVGITLFRGTAMDNVSERNSGFGFLSFNTPSNSNTPIPNAGYRGNYFADNNNGGAQVSGGTQLGLNMCQVAVCP